MSTEEFSEKLFNAKAELATRDYYRRMVGGMLLKAEAGKPKQRKHFMHRSNIAKFLCPDGLEVKIHILPQVPELTLGYPHNPAGMKQAVAQARRSLIPLRSDITVYSQERLLKCYYPPSYEITEAVTTYDPLTNEHQTEAAHKVDFGELIILDSLVLSEAVPVESLPTDKIGLWRPLP